jgi:hypothetical protein
VPAAAAAAAAAASSVVAAAAADTASVVLEGRKLDAAVYVETEVAEPAVEAAAQSGQPEDKRTDQVAPGVKPAQLGQTAHLTAKRPLVALLEPEQGLLEEGLPARVVRLLLQPASRTASHLSQGSNSTALCHQSTLSRVQGALGHREQTEDPMNQKR